MYYNNYPFMKRKK